MNVNNWSFIDADGLKAELVEKLKRLELNRSLMLTTLEIASTLSIEQLENIYNNLSKNQKKAKNGLAILELIKFKKDKENVV
jgi:hypothetical protein